MRPVRDRGERPKDARPGKGRTPGRQSGIVVDGPPGSALGKGSEDSGILTFHTTSLFSTERPTKPKIPTGFFNSANAGAFERNLKSLTVVEVNEGSRDMFEGIPASEGRADLNKAVINDGEIKGVSAPMEIEGQKLIFVDTKHGIFALSPIPPDKVCDGCPSLVGIETSRNIILRTAKGTEKFLIAIKSEAVPNILRARGEYAKAMEQDIEISGSNGIIEPVEARRIILKLAQSQSKFGRFNSEQFAGQIASVSVQQEETGDRKYLLITTKDMETYRLYKGETHEKDPEIDRVFSIKALIEFKEKEFTLIKETMKLSPGKKLLSDVGTMNIRFETTSNDTAEMDRRQIMRQELNSLKEGVNEVTNGKEGEFYITIEGGSMYKLTTNAHTITNDREIPVTFRGKPGIVTKLF